MSALFLGKDINLAMEFGMRVDGARFAEPVALNLVSSTAKQSADVVACPA